MSADPFETELTDRSDPFIDPNGTERTPIVIGRFRIERLLGEGGFGVVYLGIDEQLQRKVAIKVPKPQFVYGEEDREIYLKEARTVAGLEHPNIVPVHEVGSTPEFPIFIVSKFIVGADLAAYLKCTTPTIAKVVQWMIDLADALREAHRKGFVHRDVKPQNILIDAEERVYLVDFGLALAQQDVGKRLPAGGTPAYMSPEQARGEGHRVDGRSDLFSLGVLFYEMLTGRRPFQGDSHFELFEQITDFDPKPMRQWVDSIPQELERICFKLLAKRKSDRYSSARDLIDDLQAFDTKTLNANHLVESIRNEDLSRVRSMETKGANSDATPAAPTPTTVSRALKIVPRGLRSFDHRDADFYLELLPGARDRHGLPESVTFWKSRIEERDAELTFAVGLVYGPSGCGKSSMMKAGLLPRLSPDVVAIYLEATADETERTLMALLRKKLDSREVDAAKDLVEILQEVRRGHILPRDKKLVIVLDQFEQWLFAHSKLEGESLLESLLQCDGARVQAIVMVRDDFWMSATRFFRELDIRLLEGTNSAAVDLFSLSHAERVLKAFGRAFGALGSDGKDEEKDRKEFIADSVEGLSEGGKVVSVRLALFAEMMKGRPWTPESLREVGGTTGVGATFLEETFSASGAPPQHRYHQEAARVVLRALLPDAGTDIKGNKRSIDELRTVCHYENRQRDFEDLIQMLDGELRLITPTDAEGESQPESSRGLSLATRYYQLTHDYLVPSLREWLTRKQQETKRGRAELKLADRSAHWNGKPENRYLPTFTEWIGIRRLTDSKQWTVQQKKLMGRAGKVHGLRAGMTIAFLLTVVTIGMVVRGQVLVRQETTRMEGLIGRLLSADSSQLTGVIKELESNRQLATRFLSPFLSKEAKTVDEKRELLHAQLALVSHNQSMVEPLLEKLFTSKVSYIGTIRQQLRPYKGELIEKLRTILRDEKGEANRRFRAAVVLADFLPESESSSWTEPELQFVAEQLVISNSEFQPQLRENLRPLSKRLLPDLEKIFAEAKSTDAMRLSAANAFADFAAIDMRMLSQLLQVATPEQYAVLFPLVAASPLPSTVEELSKIAATLPPTELGSAERIPFGQRRANAAVTLVRLGEREKILPVFDMTDDPEALTQFIFRCRERGVRVEELLDLYEIVTRRQSQELEERKSSPGDWSGYGKSQICYALILAFGEYTLEDIPASKRKGFLKQLAETYRNDPSSGVHGASGWLLRHWGQFELALAVDETPVPYSLDREWFTLAINVMPKSPPDPKESVSEKKTGEKETGEKEEGKDEAILESLPQKTFYYTFVVFPAGEFEIGSVKDEPERQKDEVRHRVKLTRPFAVLDREITMGELIAFQPKYSTFMKQFDATPSDGGCAADWYDSVAFCRWLGQQLGLSEGDQSYASPESLSKEEYAREPNPNANWAPRNWPIELDRRGFRLPTESEWEIASRSSSRTSYGYGSDSGLLARFGWFQENSGKQVHPPRGLRPSIRGLFDMQGNLFEWTHDWYQDFESTEVVDPIVSEGSSYRVGRGGSWGFGAAGCRSAFRFSFDPSFRAIGYGFRLALSPSILEGEETERK